MLRNPPASSRRCRTACLCVLLVVGAAPLAQADVGGSIAVLSDYRFRGVSLSDGQPTVQARIDWSGDGGPFAGLQAVMVRLGGANADHGLALEAVAGYASSIGIDATWSAGLAGYVFPHDDAENAGNYAEAFGQLQAGDWRAGVFLSDDYLRTGAASAYFQLSNAHPLNDKLTLALHLGWLTTGRAERPYSAYDHLHRADARIGVVVDFEHVQAELSLAGILSSHDRCQSYEHCGLGPVLVIRKAF